ncbi:NUDIX domain-containing protein [Nocardia sp. NPDC127579]|uniref:NUDIX domain-containing protein n=1 Tax=Nocardia sp. NPDC127579 TaxID=3345402 RepID=UPI0036384712
MAEAFSAGILLFRRGKEGVEVLVGHMGGPFWARKDLGAWSVPKGGYVPGEEEARAAAGREFVEELGVPVPEGEWIALGEVEYGSGSKRKTVQVWAIEADLDPAVIEPGTFEMEWPPRSGKTAAFPEIDRVAWFGLDTAGEKLTKGQAPFVQRLAELLGG